MAVVVLQPLPSVGVALNVRFTTNTMCAKNNTHMYVVQTSNKSDFVRWSLLLLVATVRSFLHLPLRLSHRNSNNILEKILFTTSEVPFINLSAINSTL